MIKNIEERYNKLINDVLTKDFYKVDLTNRVNCYTCSNCKHITKTIDVDSGVTPFLFTCEKCKSRNARSSFYANIKQEGIPTFEWYRPSLEETKLIEGDATIEHILNGGLISRKIG